MPEFCFLSQNKAYLSQDHTTCYIHKYMLLGKNGRQKNQHSQCKRYPLIPCRNSFLIFDPQKTEPAYQTMDRWKQVVSNSQAYKQFGNAVTVTLAEGIGKSVISYLDSVLGGATV